MTDTIPCGTHGATHKRHDYTIDDGVCRRCCAKRQRAPRSKPVPREDFPEPMPIPGVAGWYRVRQADSVGAILTAPEIAGIIARLDAGEPASRLLRELRRGGIEPRVIETSDTDPAPSTGSSALREMTSGGTVPQGPGSVTTHLGRDVFARESSGSTEPDPDRRGQAPKAEGSVAGGSAPATNPPSEPQQGASAPPCPAAALPPTGPAASLVPPAAGPVPPPRCWQCGGAGRVAGDTFESLECDCARNNPEPSFPCRCWAAGSATTCPRCAEVGPGPRVAETREDVAARVVLRRFLEDVRRACETAINLIGTEE